MMNPNVGFRPPIILLKDGTDTSQGKGQLISNINACQAVAEAIRTTLGPRGMDKLIHDGTKVRHLTRNSSPKRLQCRTQGASPLLRRFRLPLIRAALCAVKHYE